MTIGALVFGAGVITPLKAEASTTGSQYFGYLYAWEGKAKSEMTDTFIKQVEATNGNLDVVSPNYFYLKNVQGEITDLVDPEFVQWAKLRGLKVVPMLKHDSPTDYIVSLLSSATKRTQLVDKLVQLTTLYNLDGINVDIEGVTAWKDDADLTAFMEELSTKLHKAGKLSSIAVMAKQGDNNPSWYSEYNYAKLGAAVDWLVIMAYDEHWRGGDPGPVASLGWVEKTVKYATSVVPAKKVLLGMPFYGYQWSKKSSDTKWSGRSLVYSEIKSTLTNQGRTLTWDDKSSTPTVKFTDANGENQIWFDDQYSLGFKTNLMHQYGLGGAAFWRVGQEPTDWWTSLAAYKGSTVKITVPYIQGNQPSGFPDMTNHWAKNEVAELVSQGVIGGFPDGKFYPEANITRAQLAKVIAMAKNLSLQSTDTGFSDVSSGYWAAKEIAAVRKAGIITGFPDGTFRPEGQASRAEIAKMLAVAYGLSAGSNVQSFSDVPADYWAEEYILALRTKGVTNGYANNQFKPSKQASRAETATLILRASKN